MCETDSVMRMIFFEDFASLVTPLLVCFQHFSTFDLKVHDRLYYRINAIRRMAGAQRKTDTEWETEKLLIEAKKAKQAAVISKLTFLLRRNISNLLST